MTRRVSRIKAVQALYQIEMTGVEIEEAVNSVMEDSSEDEYLTRLVKGTIENQEQVDKLLKSALERWSLSRLSRVDRAILRMAIYEMNYETDVPITVSVNEAIELTKGFNIEDEPRKFVNGVLSKIASQLEQE